MGFSMLVPAGVKASATATVIAEPKTVTLGSNQIDFGYGDCEFVDELITKLMPYFTGQILGRDTSCIPSQANIVVRTTVGA